jgi:hypothetical protein
MVTTNRVRYTRLMPHSVTAIFSAGQIGAFSTHAFPDKHLEMLIFSIEMVAEQLW